VAIFIRFLWQFLETTVQIRIVTTRPKFSLNLNKISSVRIYLSLDYELFFGHTSGSAEKCILEPTRRLMEIANRTGIRMTFFVDSGYLWKLQELASEHAELRADLEAISTQIRLLVADSHDCQLHIHPHWEDARYENGQWIFPVHRYKLADFSKEDALDIFERYAGILHSISGQKLHSYRAGGWCLQPFDQVKEAFEKLGLRQDSTVFPGGSNINEVYNYDFRSVTSNAAYRFENDLTVKDDKGSFLELPIAAHTFSPWFFWQLYGWGRVIPSRHKPLGNGFPISTSGERSQRLTKSSRLPVSMDGFFARELSSALKRNQSEDFVVIGHPKACTLYSFEQLEKFIRKHKDQHQFFTFTDRLALD